MDALDLAGIITREIRDMLNTDNNQSVMTNHILAYVRELTGVLRVDFISQGLDIRQVFFDFKDELHDMLFDIVTDNDDEDEDEDDIRRRLATILIFGLPAAIYHPSNPREGVDAFPSPDDQTLALRNSNIALTYSNIAISGDTCALETKVAETSIILERITEAHNDVKNLETRLLEMQNEYKQEAASGNMQRAESLWTEYEKYSLLYENALAEECKLNEEASELLDSSKKSPVVDVTSSAGNVSSLLLLSID